MRVPALMAGLLLASVIAPAALAQQLLKLDVTWVAVAAERDGKPADELRGHRLRFVGDTFIIQRAGKTLYRGTYKADPSKQPAQIDFRHTEGEAKGQTWRGIYVLAVDSLKIIDNAPDPSKPRPTRFTTKPDSGYVVLNFKRAGGP